MDIKTIFEIARQELIVTIRNKWTIIFAFVFGALVISISYFGMLTEGFSGMQNFTRTSASILNLVLYIVPLISLTMGTLGFTGDKGSTELLFSQPVSRSEVLFGKLLGLFLSITLSTLLGFTAAGIIIVSTAGLDGIMPFIQFILLSLALSLVFLSIGVFVAIASKRKTKAFGISLFFWFFFVLFYDLITIGGGLLLKGSSANTFLFLSLFGNPVDIVRVASLITLNEVTIFGAAGATLIRFFGGPTLSFILLVIALGIWIFFPVTMSSRLLKNQDI